MSQYPSPYQPPTPQLQGPMDYYGNPAGGAGLSRANRAGVLLVLLAGFTFVGALCCAGFGAMLPQMMAENPQAMADMPPQVRNLTPKMWQMTVLVMAGLMIVLAMVLGVLGYFVRKASKGAMIGAIIVCALVLVYFGINLLAGLAGISGGGPQAMAGACVLVVPVVVFGLQVLWLVQALPDANAAARMRDAYAQQYWQYAYQQQMYQQQAGAAAPPSQPYQQQQQQQPPPPPPDRPGSNS